MRNGREEGRVEEIEQIKPKIYYSYLTATRIEGMENVE